MLKETTERSVIAEKEMHMLLGCLTYATLLVEGNKLGNFITSQKKLTTQTNRKVTVAQLAHGFNQSEQWNNSQHIIY